MRPTVFARRVAVWWCVLALIYLVLSWPPQPVELVLAIVLGGLGGFVAARVASAEHLRLRPDPRWLRAVPRTVVTVAADCLRITALLVRPGRPRGTTHTTRLPYDHDPATARAREALATVRIGLAPGTVVIDVDSDRRVISYDRLGR